MHGDRVCVNGNTADSTLRMKQKACSGVPGSLHKAIIIRARGYMHVKYMDPPA